MSKALQCAKAIMIFQCAITFEKHSSFLPHITPNAPLLLVDLWQTTPFQFTILYFISVLMVLWLVCPFMTCGLMLLFALYFLCMGSHSNLVYVQVCSSLQSIRSLQSSYSCPLCFENLASAFMLGEAHFNTSGTEFGGWHYPWTLLASTLTNIHCLLRKEKKKPQILLCWLLVRD